MPTNRKKPRPFHALILCHPSRTSFTAAVARTYARTARNHGHRVVVRDLYRIGFDPAMQEKERRAITKNNLPHDVAHEIRLIHTADVIVLVYPIWFGSPPAMLKGYIERVFGSNFNYSSLAAAKHHPWLKGMRLLSISSSGSPVQWLELKGARDALRRLFDDYLTGIFGMEASDHLHLSGMVHGVDPDHVEKQLARVKNEALDMCASLDRPRQDHGRR